MQPKKNPNKLTNKQFKQFMQLDDLIENFTYKNFKMIGDENRRDLVNMFKLKFKEDKTKTGRTLSRGSAIKRFQEGGKYEQLLSGMNDKTWVNTDGTLKVKSVLRELLPKRLFHNVNVSLTSIAGTTKKPKWKGRTFKNILDNVINRSNEYYEGLDTNQKEYIKKWHQDKRENKNTDEQYNTVKSWFDIEKEKYLKWREIRLQKIRDEAK